MSTEDDFEMASFNHLAERAQPILTRKLAELGVSDVRHLSRAQAAAIFRSTLMEAAVLDNPLADFDGLRRAAVAMTDDDFMESLARVRAKLKQPSGAFDPAEGRDMGILLAGFGLAVAPLDRRGMGLLSPITDDLEAAKRGFAKAKSAFVGYSTVHAPFYIAVTDCWNTMRERLRSHPSLADLRQAIEQAGKVNWPGPATPFKHACILLPRQPGDRLSTIYLEDPSPDFGSVMFLAGWVEGGKPQGAPADGVMTVPVQLVRELIRNPAIPGWLRRPVGATATMQ